MSETKDHLDNDFSDSLDQCVEAFWAKNPELKKGVLRDWYAGRIVSQDSNMAGLRAVSKWLSLPTEQPGGRT
jgi:hypothetical protein